jgi:ABC-type Fe2+-enterobactin transport system substrate-binding protein
MIPTVVNPPGVYQRVPDESTVRKLPRRLGAEVVEEIPRAVIETANRETRLDPYLLQHEHLASGVSDRRWIIVFIDRPCP